jgi:tRNA modification GTPase
VTRSTIGENSQSPAIIRLTPPGRGAVATLRIEGSGALEVVQLHFHARDGRPLAAHPADSLVLGYFGADCKEQVVVRRESDGAVELHCHGGLAAVAMIEDVLMVDGCRCLAWRDWATDRFEPIAAAALAALADATTERAAAILLDQYHGAMNRALCDIRQAIGSGDKRAAEQRINALLARAGVGQHLVQPWRVVLAGQVNVGKSSLMNALAGYRRAIVHHAPGTTRDLLTVTTAIDGWPVELCDTAGLRFGSPSTEFSATPEAAPLQRGEAAIERAGIERTQERLTQADLVIAIFDRSQPFSAADQSLLDRWPDALVVHNKCDLPAASGSRPTGLSISALELCGIGELLDAIAHRLVPDPPPPGAAVPFSREQTEAVQRLADELACRDSRL